MTIRRAVLFLICLFFVLPSTPGLSTHASADEVTSKIRLLLDRYSQKNVAGVIALFSDGNILVMGSDLSEVCASKEQAAELFQNDFKLWDFSSFGSLRKIYTEETGSMVTAFFDVPFTFRRGATEQTVVVRFATVWKKTPRGLKLVQSMNTTPTVGQSAKELSSPRS